MTSTTVIDSIKFGINRKLQQFIQFNKLEQGYLLALQLNKLTAISALNPHLNTEHYFISPLQTEDPVEATWEEQLSLASTLLTTINDYESPPWCRTFTALVKCTMALASTGLVDEEERLAYAKDLITTNGSITGNKNRVAFDSQYAKPFTNSDDVLQFILDLQTKIDPSEIHGALSMEELMQTLNKHVTAWLFRDTQSLVFIEENMPHVVVSRLNYAKVPNTVTAYVDIEYANTDHGKATLAELEAQGYPVVISSDVYKAVGGKDPVVRSVIIAGSPITTKQVLMARDARATIYLVTDLAQGITND